MQLSLSHLGYLPESPKTLTLVAEDEAQLPDEVPFYIRQNCLRMRRDVPAEDGFSARFPAPYDLLRGRLVSPQAAGPLYKGMLRRVPTRWGRIWQANFSEFRAPGSYQVETDWQISPPFAIRDHVYDRIILGYLNFVRAQRCGAAVFGVHDACHLDDGVLDRDGSFHSAAGGWHDAGDFRKWLAFTLNHVHALLTVEAGLREHGDQSGFDPAVIAEEIAWGNAFFHRMVNPAGQVYEDVAGGNAPPDSAFNYENNWWFENHPGCYADASDNRWTDNVLHSGDERMVRTTYNPLVQWAFVRSQARASLFSLLPQRELCLEMAKRAASYGRQRGHDGRTLFLSAELHGSLELLATGDRSVTPESIVSLAQRLMERQAADGPGLSGYFLEAHGADAYRSIAFSAEPVLALLRFWELRDVLGSATGTVRAAGQAAGAVRAYADRYLLADSGSNPFGLTPYGVYLHPPQADRQLFRDAGQGRGVRTFIHPFNEQGIVHGTSSVLMSHAHLLAKGAALLGVRAWRDAAERLLHWCLGHNTLNRSLFGGIGYFQPVGYSFRIPQLPEAMVVGFIGRPDDTPYLEQSTAIEWNTLEYWSVPFQHAAQAASWLRN